MSPSNCGNTFWSAHSAPGLLRSIDRFSWKTWRPCKNAVKKFFLIALPEQDNQEEKIFLNSSQGQKTSFQKLEGKSFRSKSYYEWLQKWGMKVKVT